MYINIIIVMAFTITLVPTFDPNNDVFKGKSQEKYFLNIKKSFAV